MSNKHQRLYTAGEVADTARKAVEVANEQAVREATERLQADKGQQSAGENSHSYLAREKEEHEEGYRIGRKETYDDAYGKAYQSGYEEGRLRGEQEGGPADEKEGYKAGYDETYQDAYDEMYGTSFDQGCNDGRCAGEKAGEEEGYKAGSEKTSNGNQDEARGHKTRRSGSQSIELRLKWLPVGCLGRWLRQRPNMDFAWGVVLQFCEILHAYFNSLSISVARTLNWITSSYETPEKPENFQCWVLEVEHLSSDVSPGKYLLLSLSCLKLEIDFDF